MTVESDNHSRKKCCGEWNEAQKKYLDESFVGVGHNKVGRACCQQAYNESRQDDGLEISHDGKFGNLLFQDSDSNKMGTSTSAYH